MNGLSRIRGATIVAAAGASAAVGQTVDFNDFTTWNWPDVGGFDVPDWVVTDDGASSHALGNIIPSVYYDDSVSIDGMRISGVLNPGRDDDVVGFVFGYTADDDFNVQSGEYLVLDWKGVDQRFDWVDPTGAEGTFHDITPGTLCRHGIRLMRAEGVPTADELWGGVDLEENNMPPAAPGAVTEIARADILGRAPYHDSDWVFTIDYTTTNIKVWVNGVQILDVDGDFPDSGFGLLEMAQDSGDKPEQGLWSDWTIEAIPGTPPPALGLPFWTTGVSAANISNADTAHPPMGNETSIWTVDQTSSTNEWSISSDPNNGDFASNINGEYVNLAGGVMTVTVRENRDPGSVAVAQVYRPGAFGGLNRGVMQVATAFAADGGETNVDVATAYFPYADGYIGGHVNVNDNAITSANPDATYELTHLESPNEDDQDGLWNLSISEGTPDVGLLFSIAATNEDNFANATPNGDDWRIGVRDSFSEQFGGPETFEFDHWSFLYLPISRPGLTGGFVTGFDGNGDAETSISAGSYELEREATGSYRLTVSGETAQEGVLLLTPAASIDLGGGVGTAPLNHFLSYEPDGSDFLIQQIQMGTFNTPVDGAFAFAFIPFDPNGSCFADCDGNGTLNILDFVCYQGLFQNGNPGADCDGNGILNILDFVCFQQAFQAGCN